MSKCNICEKIFNDVYDFVFHQSHAHVKKVNGKFVQCVSICSVVPDTPGYNEGCLCVFCSNMQLLTLKREKVFELKRLKDIEQQLLDLRSESGIWKYISDADRDNAVDYSF